MCQPKIVAIPIQCGIAALKIPEKNKNKSNNKEIQIQYPWCAIHDIELIHKEQNSHARTAHTHILLYIDIYYK